MREVEASTASFHTDSRRASENRPKSETRNSKESGGVRRNHRLYREGDPFKASGRVSGYLFRGRFIAKMGLNMVK